MDTVSNIDSFIWPNRYMLDFLGFWPPELNCTSVAARHFAIFRIVFSIIAICFLFVPEILMLIVYWGDITILTGVGCVTTTLSQLTFKMIYVLARRRSFCQVYRTIRELWSTSSDDELERHGLVRLAVQAKRCSVAFFVTCFCNNVSFTATSVVVWLDYNARENKTSLERRLPFDVWFGFDLQRTPNFEIVFGCQSVAAIYCCVGIVGFDATMMTLILHVSGHFRVISAKLRSIGKKMHKDIESQKPIHYPMGHIESRMAIRQCIEYHRRIIKFAEEVRNLLSPIIFMQLLTSGLEICLSGYAIIVSSNGKSGELAKCTGYFVSIFVQLIIWCWPGQLLIQDSTAVGDVVCYELPWYHMTAEQQRELVFIIVRAQKECHITALGFQVMSMGKLTEVFNTAGSYLALLRRVYETQIDEM